MVVLAVFCCKVVFILVWSLENNHNFWIFVSREVVFIKLSNMSKSTRKTAKANLNVASEQRGLVSVVSNRLEVEDLGSVGSDEGSWSGEREQG